MADTETTDKNSIVSELRNRSPMQRGPFRFLRVTDLYNIRYIVYIIVV